MQPNFPQKPENSAQDTNDTTPNPFDTSQTQNNDAFSDDSPNTDTVQPSSDVVDQPAALDLPSQSETPLGSSTIEPTASTDTNDQTIVSSAGDSPALEPAEASMESAEQTPNNQTDTPTAAFSDTSSVGSLSADQSSGNAIDTSAGGVFGTAVPAVAADSATPLKSRFNKKVVGIIAAIAAVLLTSSAVLAYVVISNTPEMILRDAFYNTSSKTEGLFDATLEAESNGQDFRVTALGAYKNNAIRSDITFESDMLPSKKLVVHQYAADKKFYLKVDNVRKHIDEFSAEMGPEYGQFLSFYDSLINKIDSKWVVITEDDLEKYFGYEPEKNDVSVCVENALKKYQSDKKQQGEVFEVYKKNQFFAVEKKADENVGDRSAYHFSVTLDEQKAESFGEAIKSTAIYKAVRDCAPDDVSNMNDSSDDTSKTDDPMPDMQLWIDKQTRTLRKIQVKTTEEQEKKDKQKATAVVTFDYFSAVTMNEPKADVTIEELNTEIEKITQQFMVPQTAPVSAEPTLQTVLGISDIRL